MRRLCTYATDCQAINSIRQGVCVNSLWKTLKTYVDGKLNGLYCMYGKDDIPIVYGHFVNDIKHGKWSFDGEKREYECGKLIRKKQKRGRTDVNVPHIQFYHAAIYDVYY